MFYKKTFTISCSSKLLSQTQKISQATIQECTSHLTKCKIIIQMLFHDSYSLYLYISVYCTLYTIVFCHLYIKEIFEFEDNLYVQYVQTIQQSADSFIESQSMA